MFVVLELFTNLVLETVLYAGAVGVSQVALLVSVAFWTWLWGPLGLLMASSLTVCLVVLGKHVPGLAFVGLLMADTPALAPEYGFYQRLVARDQSEAAELIDSHIKTAPPESVYDALLLPALSYADRDLLEHRLSSEEEAAVIEATRELIADAAETIGRHAEAEAPAAAAGPSRLAPREPLRVLGYAVNGAADEVALAMLAHLIDDLPITAARMQAVELVSLVRDRRFSVVCFADLPPSSSSKTRSLVRRLRSTLPDFRIAVGRWAPPAAGQTASGTAGAAPSAGSAWRHARSSLRCWDGASSSPVGSAMRPRSAPRRRRCASSPHNQEGVGRWLLGATAAGFVAYGFYQIIRARYLHIRIKR